MALFTKRGKKPCQNKEPRVVGQEHSVDKQGTASYTIAPAVSLPVEMDGLKLRFAGWRRLSGVQNGLFGRGDLAALLMS